MTFFSGRFIIFSPTRLLEPISNRSSLHVRLMSVRQQYLSGLSQTSTVECSRRTVEITFVGIRVWSEF